MKILIIGITFLVAFHVGNVEAAEWMPLDEAEDRQLIRTNQSPEEGHIICTSKTRGGEGIGVYAGVGRRLGFLTKKGCKTIGGGDKVRWFKRENGDLMVLVDDEPAVQDDAQNEGEDYQARYEEARDAAAKAVQQLQDAQEREANLQEQHDAALEGMVSEEDVQGKIDAALEGMVTADDVERREEGLQARHDSLISSNIHAALEGMVSEADVQGQIETALVGMVAEADVDRRVEAALEGMVLEKETMRELMVYWRSKTFAVETDVQGQIKAALVGMVAVADVTPLNCSEGTAVNAAGDACEPTAEYRAAAVEEGRLAGRVSYVKSSFDYGGEEAGWVPKPGGERWRFVRGVGMPTEIIVYGPEYGGKILVKSEDGGWVEDTSTPHGQTSNNNFQDYIPNAAHVFEFLDNSYAGSRRRRVEKGR